MRWCLLCLVGLVWLNVANAEEFSTSSNALQHIRYTSPSICWNDTPAQYPSWSARVDSDENVVASLWMDAHDSTTGSLHTPMFPGSTKWSVTNASICRWRLDATVDPEQLWPYLHEGRATADWNTEHASVSLQMEYNYNQPLNWSSVPTNVTLATMREDDWIHVNLLQFDFLVGSRAVGSSTKSPQKWMEMEVIEAMPFVVTSPMIGTMKFHTFSSKYHVRDTRNSLEELFPGHTDVILPSDKSVVPDFRAVVAQNEREGRRADWLYIPPMVAELDSDRHTFATLEYLNETSGQRTRVVMRFTILTPEEYGLVLHSCFYSTRMVMIVSLVVLTVVISVVVWWICTQSAAGKWCCRKYNIDTDERGGERGERPPMTVRKFMESSKRDIEGNPEDDHAGLLEMGVMGSDDAQRHKD